MNFIPPIPNSLEQHWMPFTANRHFKANPRILTRAEGMYFTTDHGDKVIDGSAGLFCVAAGHGRREIAEAVNEALTTLDYAPPFQFGHPASFESALRLASVTPADLRSEARRVGKEGVRPCRHPGSPLPSKKKK